jgi:hypothetical protein
MSKSVLERYRQYTEVSYAGTRLLRKHSLDEVGIWKIKGEDPNCDLGGHHHQPELGIVEGKLRDVIMYGVSLPSFWSWGGGGDFELVSRSIPKVDADSVAVRAKMEEALKAAEEQVAELKRQLGNR